MGSTTVVAFVGAGSGYRALSGVLFDLPALAGVLMKEPRPVEDLLVSASAREEEFCKLRSLVDFFGGMMMLGGCIRGAHGS